MELTEFVELTVRAIVAVSSKFVSAADEDNAQLLLLSLFNADEVLTSPPPAAECFDVFAAPVSEVDDDTHTSVSLAAVAIAVSVNMSTSFALS